MGRELLLVLLVAGCAADGEPGLDHDPDLAPPRLLMDIQVSDTSVSMVAREPDRPCQCSFGWTEEGSCREQSDAIGCSCDPWPASCLEEVAVESGDQRLAESTWDPSWWGVSLTLETAAGDQLVIAGCGGEVSVPLPGPSRPAAAVALEGPGLVTWSSDPVAASSITARGDGYGGESCHVAGGSGSLEIGPEDRYVSVTALASPVEHETELGTVRVWSGNGSQLTIE